MAMIPAFGSTHEHEVGCRRHPWRCSSSRAARSRQPSRRALDPARPGTAERPSARVDHRLGRAAGPAARRARPNHQPGPTIGPAQHSPAQPSARPNTARPNTARPSHRPEGTFARQRGDATPGRGSDVPESLVIAIRSTATFFTMLALTRVLGKRQLAQLNFFDYVFGITGGSIAASLSIEPD